MYSRLTSARTRFRSTLTVEQLFGVKILGCLSIFVIVGLALTGTWQFFAHESDPSWFDHIPGSNVRQAASPSTGAASLRGAFSTAAGALALIGGAWFAYKVVFDVPWVAVLAVALVIVGSLTGSTIRFNAVQVNGRAYGDANAGYLQLFTDDVGFVVTDKWDLGATAIRALTVSHILLLPVLLAVAWFSLPRATQTNTCDLLRE